MEQVKQAVLVDGPANKERQVEVGEEGRERGKGVYCSSGELSFAYYPYSQPYDRKIWEDLGKDVLV